MKLFIDDKTDREAVALALVKNGYTVRIDRERDSSTKAVKYKWYVEYKEE